MWKRLERMEMSFYRRTAKKTKEYAGDTHGKFKEENEKLRARIAYILKWDNISHNTFCIGYKTVEQWKRWDRFIFVQHLKKWNIDQKIFISLNSLVRSRIVCGCQAWQPSHSEMSEMLSVYRRFHWLKIASKE